MSSAPQQEIKEPSWIVCGWYTPDYAAWAERFVESLERHNAPYDIVAVEKVPGGWERNTMRKARFVLDALDRHPGKTIIFSDVDAVVTGDIDRLASLPCDIALQMYAKRLFGRTVIVARSGTIVIHPTPLARRFVENWAEASKNAPYGEVDQSALAQALWDTPSLRIHTLDNELFSIISHDRASLEQSRITNFDKAMQRILSRALRLLPV